MYAFVIIALAANPDAVVPLLSHDDWRTRDSATTILALAGTHAKPALVKVLNDSPDPEARVRASRLLTRLHNQRVNSFRPMPPIDGLWYCDKEFRYVYGSDTKGGPCAENHKKYGKYLQAAQGMSSADGDYPQYRRATRILVEDWMHDGKSDQWIREQLADMTRRDNLWRKKEAEAAERRRLGMEELPNSEDVPPPGVPMIMPGPLGIGVPWFPLVIDAKDAVIK
jgi:hypothetical protein